MDDGSEKPIAFTSQLLSPAEKSYAQLDKEALAIVFRVMNFWQYLLGHTFTILSDHKPLMYLFGEHKDVLVNASAHLQRWALILSVYKYTIQYKRGDHYSNADVLSRLPLPDSLTYVPTLEDTVLLLDLLNRTPVTVQKIKQWTDHDSLLSKVHECICTGWDSIENKKRFALISIGRQN